MAQSAQRVLEMTARGILVAIGNPLRRDDGAACRVLDLLPQQMGWEQRRCQQLTPEVGAELAAYQTVVFLDADAMAEQARLDRLPDAAGSNALSHASTAAEVAALARKLFGFTGHAWLCRIPASDFSHGEGLSTRAEAAARDCAHLLQHLQLRSPHELHFAGKKELGDEQAPDLGHETDAAVFLRDLG